MVQIGDKAESKATPFEDTPNDVLRRALGLTTETPASGVKDSDTTSNVAKDYSGQRVTAYRLYGRVIPCRFFKDILVNLSNELRASNQAAFDKVAVALHGRKRLYFSKHPALLKAPHELSGKGLFVETNLSANQIVEICRTLLEKLGLNADDFAIDSSG